MRPPIIELALLLAAMSGALPASAELFKWVDERGTVTYSDRRPVDPKAADKVQSVAGRLSVYSPDKVLLQAVDAWRQRKYAPDDQFEPVRQAGPYMAGIPAQGYDPCLQGSCADFYGYDAYGYPVYGRRFRHPTHFTQTFIPPGAIAGTITSLNGMNGMIPGNTAGFNSMIPGNTTGFNGMIPGNTAGFNGFVPGNVNPPPRARPVASRPVREPLR